MKFSSLVTPVVVVAVVVVAAAVGVPAVLGDCTSSQRLATLAQINDAFNEPDLFTATQKIRAFPLQEDCPAIVAINGLPGIEFGFDATSSKNFAIIARQVFNKVVTQYTDYGNGTSLFDAVITLGLVKLVDLPLYAHAFVPIEFNLTNCLITKLPAFVTVPSNIAGNPVNPPIVPTIPGLVTIPGIREVLKLLIPVIGNIYGI